MFNRSAGRLLWALWLLPATALAVTVANRLGVHDPKWPDRYDGLFRKYTKHYFGPHVDWRWFKAQGIAESNLDPRAVSAVGAKGIMQIMPQTYAEIRKKNPFFRHIDEPRWNIAAGIWYDRDLYRKWKQGLPTGERLSFAFASYNAGFGRVRKAYRRAEGEYGEVRRWQQVEPHVPGQTRHYVRRISGLMQPDD